VLKPGPFDPTGVPLLRIQDLAGNRVAVDGVHKITQELDAEYSRSRLEGGEVLLSIQGTVGRVAIVPPAMAGANISRTLAVIAPDSRLDRPFLRYYFEHLTGLRAYDTGGTTRASLNISTIRKMSVPVPPLNEQRRIVAAIEEHLSRLDAADAYLKKAGARLTELRRVASTVPFEADWPTEALAKVTDPERPIRYGILMPKEHIDDGVLYVRVRDYPRDIVELDDLRRTSHEIAATYKRSALREGDVLLAIRGTYGRVAIVPPELDGGNITQDTARIAPLERLGNRYLAAYLRSEAAQRYFQRVARGVAVKGVNIGDLRIMQIPVPPAEEQWRIVSDIEERLSAIDALRISIDRARRRAASLRRAVLERAFRGQLVPQDPSDEPASALLERIRAERAAAPTPVRRRRVSA
jgi:type I restriction enzyme S subunit